MPEDTSICWILPRGQPRRRAYVCIPVEDSLAQRSPVIETLMESGGIAELPDGVTVSGLALWSSMDPDLMSSRTTADIAQALQVADKICDKHADRLAVELASRVLQTWPDSSDTRYGDAPDPGETERGILCLEPHLQQLVLHKFQKVDNRHTSYRLCLFLERCPLPLQHVFVEALAASKDGITIANGIQPATTNAILSMLTRAKAWPQGLHSLTISAEVSTTTTSLLCQALQHHACSLVSLHLHQIDAPADHSLLPTILHAAACISRLTDLTIPSEVINSLDPSAAAAALRSLAAAIPTLPSLQCFCLYHDRKIVNNRLSQHRPNGPEQKRLRLTDSLSAPPPHDLSIDPVMTALSTAPALTSVTLQLQRSDATLLTSHSINTGSVRSSGTMAVLQKLSLAVDTIMSLAGVRALAAVAAKFPALTALKFQVGNVRVADRDQDTDVAAASAALHPLRALSQLQSLSLVLCTGSTQSIDLFATAVEPGLLPSFTSLTKLKLGSATGSVCLSQIAHRICELTSLQHLQVHSIGRADSADLRACLAPLTSLTALVLSLCDIGKGYTRALAQCASGMPALRIAKVTGHDKLDGWAQGLLELPAWGSYVFMKKSQNVYKEKPGDQVVREALEARGASVAAGFVRVAF